MIESLEENTNPDKTNENGDFNLLISNNNIMRKKGDWVLNISYFVLKLCLFFLNIIKFILYKNLFFFLFLFLSSL